MNTATARTLLGVAPAASFFGGFVAALGAAILATTVIGQRGLSRWQDASLSLGTLIVVIGSGLAVGAAAARLGSQLGTTDPLPSLTVPRIDLAAGERAVWTGTLGARWPVALGTAVVATALVAGLLGQTFVAAISVLGAAAVFTLARIRVTADRTGLRVRYGWLPWPRTSIPARRIDTATVIDIDPKAWGGWGYRGSLWLMKRAAVVLRSGPGIRLDLKDGRVFVVTVDEPATAVAILLEAARPAEH